MAGERSSRGADAAANQSALAGAKPSRRADRRPSARADQTTRDRARPLCLSAACQGDRKYDDRHDVSRRFAHDELRRKCGHTPR